MAAVSVRNSSKYGVCVCVYRFRWMQARQLRPYAGGAKKTEMKSAARPHVNIFPYTPRCRKATLRFAHCEWLPCSPTRSPARGSSESPLLSDPTASRLQRSNAPPRSAAFPESLRACSEVCYGQLRRRRERAASITAIVVDARTLKAAIAFSAPHGRCDTLEPCFRGSHLPAMLATSFDFSCTIPTYHRDGDFEHLRSDADEAAYLHS